MPSDPRLKDHSSTLCGGKRVHDSDHCCVEDHCEASAPESDGAPWQVKQDLCRRAVFLEIPNGGRVGCFQQLRGRRKRERRGTERASEGVGRASLVAADRKVERIVFLLKKKTLSLSRLFGVGGSRTSSRCGAVLEATSVFLPWRLVNSAW